MRADARRAMPALLAALLLAAEPFAAAEAPPERLNLLVVCFNCLNKFRTSLYGHDRRTTPSLEKFAQDAWVFHNAVSPTTWTPPALRELLAMRFNERAFYDDKRQMYFADTKTLRSTRVGQVFTALGYEVAGSTRPETPAKEPFFAFYHPTALHSPYDRLFLYAERVEGDSRRLYDELRRKMTELNFRESTEGIWPNPLLAMGFGHPPAYIFADLDATWKDMAAALAEPGGLRRKALRALLPRDLREHLAAEGPALPLDEKRRVVEFLNRGVSQPHPVFRKALERDFLFPKNAYSVVYRGRPLGTSHPLTLAVMSGLRNGFFQRAGNKKVRIRPGKFSETDLDRLRLLARNVLAVLFPEMRGVGGSSPFASANLEVLDKWQGTPDFSRELQLLKDLYDEVLKDLDAETGAFFEDLKRRGLWDRTVIVFMGDHGEAFFEHGRIIHGFNDSHDEVVSAPLIIRVPGALAARVDVRTQVRFVDLFPTLFDLLGLPWRERVSGPVDGESYAEALRTGRPEQGRDAFTLNLLDSYGLRTADGWKFILDATRDVRHLYDLRADPREKNDLLEKEPDRAAEMEERVRRYIDRP